MKQFYHVCSPDLEPQLCQFPKLITISIDTFVQVIGNIIDRISCTKFVIVTTCFFGQSILESMNVSTNILYLLKNIPSDPSAIDLPGVGWQILRLG
jgi:hypothetical protein